PDHDTVSDGVVDEAVPGLFLALGRRVVLQGSGQQRAIEDSIEVGNSDPESRAVAIVRLALVAYPDVEQEGLRIPPDPGLTRQSPPVPVLQWRLENGFPEPRSRVELLFRPNADVHRHESNVITCRHRRPLHVEQPLS